MVDEKSKPIGILFVHGIGAEKQGETLVGYSEPLFKWYVRWLNQGARSSDASADSRPFLEATHTDLHPEDGSPAHSRWVLHTRDDNNIERETHWIAAEAWWAEAFPASNWSETKNWAFNIVPSILFFQISNFVKRVLSKRRGEFLMPLLAAFFSIPYVVVGILLLFLLQLAGLALGILALIPIAPLRSVTKAIQMILSHWAGDIYLLLTSPIQHSAMVSKVKKDLNWLKSRCSQVVIVAHSQGAAISYQVLQEDRSPKIKGFVTLGSAIKLLKKVESLQESTNYKVFAFVMNFFVVPALIAGLSYFFISLRPFFLRPAGFEWQNLLAPMMVLMFVGMLLMLAVKTSDPVGNSWDPLDGEASIARGKGFGWYDLYASSDPAPDGRLSERPPDFLQSRQVYNRANLVLDHTTYWSNLDEFVSAVAVFIHDVTGSQFLIDKSDYAACIEAANARRRRRFLCLILSRSVALVCAIVLLFGLRSDLKSMGSWVLSTTDQLLPGFSATDSVDTVARPLGGLVVILATVLWHVFAGGIWRWWQTLDTDKLFQRKREESGGLPVILISALIGILWLGTVVTVVVRREWVMVAAFAVFSIMLYAGVQEFRRQSRDRREAPARPAAPARPKARRVLAQARNINLQQAPARAAGRGNTSRESPAGDLLETVRLVLSVVLCFFVLASDELFPALEENILPLVLTFGMISLAWWNTIGILQTNAWNYKRIVSSVSFVLNLAAFAIWLFT